MSNWKEAHGNWYDGTPPILNPRVITPGSRGHRSDILGDPEPYPDPFGTDLFDRVEAPTKGKQFLDGVVASALGSVGGLAGDAAKKGLGGLIGGIGGTFL